MVKEKAVTVNNAIKMLSLGDEDVILIKRKNDKMHEVTECTAADLKGDKRQVYYIRQHAGGMKYGYNATLIVTQK